AHVCEVCTSASPNCVMKNPSYTFPALKLATAPPTIAPPLAPLHWTAVAPEETPRRCATALENPRGNAQIPQG
ncbi:hypothetical protein SPRG_17635, partial [Saprolegnia parasitica CBS 223.65]